MEGPSEAPVCRAVLASLGGTPEPLCLTIAHLRPEFAVLLVSQQSAALLGDVKRRCDAAGAATEFRHFSLDRADDLVEAYGRGLSAVQWLQDRGVAPHETLADVTGGTKVMAVGLALAAVRWGCPFGYVSGGERINGGLGTVVPGSEISRAFPSPWALFAVEEMRLLAHQFNTYQFAAAAGLVRRLIEGGAVWPPQRTWLEILEGLIAGYENWERFDHKKAVDALAGACGRIQDFAATTADHTAAAVAQVVDGNLKFLRRLQEDSKGFQRLVQGHVVDLVANADRRAEEGKFDDAVARLYRAVEMLGQIAFEKRFLCRTDQVKPANLPDAVREEHVRKYGSGDGPLKLPLWAVYGALAEAGDSLGARFRQSEEELKAVMNARNESILAHGTRPCSSATYESLRVKVLALGNLAEEELVKFPRM